MDEGFDEGFALEVGADLDDRIDLVRDFTEGRAWRHDGFVVDLGGEFGVAAAELFLLGTQGGESGGEGFFIEGATLEGGQVAVDGLVGLSEVGLDGGEFAGAVGVGVVMASAGVVDGVGDELLVVAVELGECGEDGLVEGVGVEAGCVAAVAAVAQAGEAGVVAVGAVAALCVGAEHRFGALRAAHPAGEVVVGVAGCPVGVSVAADGEDLLGFGEQGLVDDRLVGVGDGDLSEGQFAEVDAVVQDADDLVSGPGAAGGGAVAALVEGIGDGAGADPVPDVEVEDQADDGGFLLVDEQFPVGAVDLVAEGPVAAHPQALGGFAFHAGDDAVDDRVSLELREHREHLEQLRPMGVAVSNGSVAERNTTPAWSSSSSRVTVSRRLRESRSTR